MVKSHRIALDPTDRQASLMLEHAGWARVAANWARGRFQLAWFGETDALDARVLARDGQVFPVSDTGPSENEEERGELQQLLRRRRQRVDPRVQERNRLD